MIKEVFEYHYDSSSFSFGTDKGFAVAAGLTAFDGSRESIEDESIGTVKFYLKSWQNEEELNLTELESAPCTGID